MNFSDDPGGGTAKDKTTPDSKIMSNQNNLKNQGGGIKADKDSGVYGEKAYMTGEDGNTLRQSKGMVDKTSAKTSLGRGGGIASQRNVSDGYGSKWSDVTSDDSSKRSENTDGSGRMDEYDDYSSSTEESYGQGPEGIRKGIQKIEEIISTLENLDRAKMTEDETKERDETLKEAYNTLNKGIKKLQSEQEDMAVETEEGDFLMAEPSIVGKRRAREDVEKEKEKEDEEGGWTIAGKKQNKNKQAEKYGGLAGQHQRYKQTTLSAIVKAGGALKTGRDTNVTKTANANKKTEQRDTEKDLSKKERVMEDYKWGDISDDETVVQQNQEEIQWKLVEDKKGKRKPKDDNNSEEHKSNNQETASIGNRTNTSYGTKNQKKTSNNNTSEHNHGANKSSLSSYLEITKDKVRKENKTAIGLTISFTPRTSGAGELLRVAKEILNFGQEIDKDMLLLTWEHHPGFGPINSEDTANPTNIGENIRNYFFKPYHVNFQPGSPAYGIGLHLSTNYNKHEFMTRWNLKKQEYKQNNRAAYSIALAPMQKSPTSFIIGIAVGSTERQDYELLNKKLGEETGVDGIEVSFQNINQAGITQEFWKHANDKASVINQDKYSRDHLREKYRWAPNALAVYVPTKDLVNSARKIMLSKYGKSVEGGDPVWPDGSSMRFLPIKGPIIKNEKTRNIVRKRMAYHIWLKVNKISIDTNFVNIHETVDAFHGLTFAEIILQLTNEDDIRVFSHFNRAWSNDPGKERWALSIQSQMQESASKVYNNIRDTLHDIYGSEIDKFFLDARRDTGWRDIVVNTNQYKDDEDDWFDDEDDIDEVVKRGIIDSSFIHFFGTKKDEDDKLSVVSWGTGNTTYTEMVATKDTGSTGISSITQESTKLSDEDIDTRKDIVKVRLLMRDIPETEVENIMQNNEPYQLAFSGIHLQSWDAEKEVYMIMAIREQYQTREQSK